MNISKITKVFFLTILVPLLFCTLAKPSFAETLYSTVSYGSIGGNTCSPALGNELYKFEGMQPTLMQPWFFSMPRGIAIDSLGYVYLTDYYNHRVVKMTSDGHLVTKWGFEGEGNGEFKYPYGIAVDDDGNVYVSDNRSILAARIQKFTSDGVFVEEFTAQGGLDRPKGLTVGGNGNLYVADYGGHKVLELDTSSGDILNTWGDVSGAGTNQFNSPSSVAVAPDGSLYVADTGNSRIQVIGPDGVFSHFGIFGDGSGQLEEPADIVFSAGNISVVDKSNGRVHRFTTTGQFVDSFGQPGTGNGQLGAPFGIVVDKDGNSYIAEGGNNRIQKFDPSGQYINKWGSAGSEAGKFKQPYSIISDIVNGLYYVADTFNYRIQKFAADGSWLANLLLPDNGPPIKLALDSNNNILVTDSLNARFIKFDPNWNELFRQGTLGGGDLQFYDPVGIATDSSDNIYVVDRGLSQIKKFSPDGSTLLMKIEMVVDSEAIDPQLSDIVIDSADNIYVVDENYHHVLKLTYNSNNSTWSASEWGDTGSKGIGNCQFKYPYGLAYDGANIFVADTGNNRIQKFNPDGTIVASIGTFGTAPGQLNTPKDLSIGADGKLLVIDSDNNRVQVLSPVTSSTGVSKAIVLAGGGPYAGNNLWDATQMNANFAYRTLNYRGFSKDDIQYLSYSYQLDLDLDDNGLPDDIDADATNVDLHSAISTWASDADNLTLYVVDHGGDGTFRMSESETMEATELQGWLNTWQLGKENRKLSVVYDACRSGTFQATLDPLSAPERIVATSTSPLEDAWFLSGGAISFSNFFWSHIFNGDSIGTAFTSAKDSMAYSVNTSAVSQVPVLNDSTLAASTFIGDIASLGNFAPVIGSVTPGHTISNPPTETISAFGVTDADGIARVWAVVRPPNFSQIQSGSAVLELPSFELSLTSANQYGGSYDGFTQQGTYQLAIYAMDGLGNISLPQFTSVTVDQPLKRKALIVGGSSGGNAALQQAIKNNLKLSYDTLIFQGYSNLDILLLSDDVAQAGRYGDANIYNLQYAISNWSTDAEDLLIYMIGEGGNEVFNINSTEILTPFTLDSLVDGLQQAYPCKVTIIYDASYSGSFVPWLMPPSGVERIIITSSTAHEPAHYQANGTISFSEFFWKRVINGSNLRYAFNYAKKAVYTLQTALLDDNSNGIGNEKFRDDSGNIIQDGLLANAYTIGSGIMLAGDDPIIGSHSPGQNILSGAEAVLWVEKITATAHIKKVWALVSPPPGEPIQIQTIELLWNESSNRYETTYSDFTEYGYYSIFYYAMDFEENVSLPAESFVYQPSASNKFEVNDTFSQAKTIYAAVAENTPKQYHEFDSLGDHDWVKFYAEPGYQYTILIDNSNFSCDFAIDVYDSSENLLTNADNGWEGEGESLTWNPADYNMSAGLVYIDIYEVWDGCAGSDSDYILSVTLQTGGIPGYLLGFVSDNVGSGIANATVTIANSVYSTSTLTDTAGVYFVVVPSGTYTVTVNAAGFPTQVNTGVVVREQNSKDSSFFMAPADTTPPAVIVSYSPSGPTNQNVTAIITPDEPVIITSVGGASHVFTSNGDFTFTFIDTAGNTGEEKASVDWIDKTAPTANAGGDQKVFEDVSLVNLDGTLSTDTEAGSGINTYFWEQVSGTSSINLQGPATPSPSFAPPTVGANGEILEFKLTITDNVGQQGTSTCTVTVYDVADLDQDRDVDGADLADYKGEYDVPPSPPVAIGDFSGEFGK